MLAGDLMEKIAVVIVLYYSDKNDYNLLLNDSAISIIVVDNTPNRELTLTGRSIYYIPLKENKGIATAQNVGICKAQELGCTYVLFFDQDSVVKANYIEHIVSEYIHLKKVYPNLAVLGPTVVNKETGKKYKSVHKSQNQNYIILPSLISSGSVIEMNVIDDVGMMEEDLFIDSVDFEWCWRAKSKGYVCAMSLTIELLHKVGQKEYSFCGFPVILSAPIRYYYQYRNFLWLIRRNYVPLKWKINVGIRKLAEIILLPFYVKAKRTILKNIFLGIKDGLRRNNYIR